jgi:hypothetical protein
MITHVYVGPSLAALEVAATLPGLRLHAPLRAGDLAREDFGLGDRVLLIDADADGSDHPPAEIGDLLRRGVEVTGAAAMGAVWAARSQEPGLAGVGEVFALYQAGTLTDQEDVAVDCGPPPDYARASESLVNIRYALKLSAQIGFVGTRAAAAILGHARALPRASRSWPAIEESVRRGQPALLTVLTLVRGYVGDNGPVMDLQAIDARRAVAFVTRPAAEFVAHSGARQ